MQNTALRRLLSVPAFIQLAETSFIRMDIDMLVFKCKLTEPECGYFF